MAPRYALADLELPQKHQRLLGYGGCVRLALELRP